MKLLVPTAGPVPARERAEYIMNIAKVLKADVSVLHIKDEGETGEGQEALDIFSETGKRLGVNVETHLKEGEVVPTICDLAESKGADLIVMGASEGRIIAQWIVSEVLEKTKVPVVIIPYGFTGIIE